MKSSTRTAIESNVQKLLATVDLDKPPIDLVKIARSLGVPIRREVLPKEVSGFLYRQDGESLIVVNSKQPPKRQRFTIAHEIGHLMLDHKRDEIHVDKAFLIKFRSDHPSSADDLEEIQANAFAAALLMPKSMLQRDLKRYHNGESMDDGALMALAERYDVSIQAFLIRLNTIDLPITLSDS